MAASFQKADSAARQAAYDAALKGAPEASFYHTRTWANIVAGSFPALENGSGLLQVGDAEHALPLFVWRRAGGILRTCHSSFAFLYGGPVPATSEAWRAAESFLAKLPGSGRLTGNPFAAGDRPEPAPASGTTGAHLLPRASAPWHVGTETTHLLTLPRSAEAYWDDVLTTRKRNDVRRLTRKGVTVDPSRDPADVRAVYDLYLQRMATWNQVPGIIYPLRLYENMMAQGADAVRLYIARFEEKLIGGTFVCRYNGLVHYHAGYFDGEARRLRPNVLVQERIVRDAIEDGYRIYDMLPSAGIASVEEFKESFGGIKTTFPVWNKTGVLHRLIGRLRR